MLCLIERLKAFQDVKSEIPELKFEIIDYVSSS